MSIRVRFICACCSLMACYISAGSCCSTQNVTRQRFEGYIMSRQKSLCDIRWEETSTFQHILVNRLVVPLRAFAGMPRVPHALPRGKRTYWLFVLQGMWLQVSVQLLHIATVSIFRILKNTSRSLCYVNINVLQRVIILTDILQPTQGKSIPVILYAASKEDNFKGFENKYNIPGEQVNAAPQQFSY